jgi:hypothetical protein
MSRPSVLMRTVVGPRWSAWLSRVMAAAGLNTAALASEIRPGAAIDDKPRSLVKAWCEGKSAPTALLVFEAGEALRTLGVDWCNGAVALYAAGYRAEFVRFVAALAPISRSRAVILALLGGTVADPIVFAADEEAELARAVVAESYDHDTFAEAWRLALLKRAPKSHWRLVLAEQIALAAAAQADETAQQFLDSWAWPGAWIGSHLTPLISDEHRRLLAWGSHRPPATWTSEQHGYTESEAHEGRLLDCARAAIAGRAVSAAPVSPNPESVALLAAQRPRKDNRS